MFKFLKARGLLLFSFLALSALACDLTAITSYLPTGATGITNAVMANQIRGDTNEAIGITDIFPPDQKELHAVITIANVPQNTPFRAVWTAVDVGGAMDPGTKLTETEGKFDGSQNLDFALRPARGSFAPGKYKVEVYMNNTLERTLNFTIEGPPQARVTATPPAQAQASPTAATRTTTGPGTASIANAVMARDVSPVTLTARGIGDNFPSDQKVFHAVVTLKEAPAGTRVKVVWTSVDSGENLGDYTLTAEGAQNLDFTYTAGSPGLKPGKYKVDVSLNDKFDRTLAFVVSSQAARPGPTSTRQPVGKCPPPPPPNYKPPLIAQQVIMAKGTQGADLEPSNPTRFFDPSDTFYAIVHIENAPANTKVKSVWFIEDIGDEEPCNTQFRAPGEITTSGTRNLSFSQKPPNKWPKGIYHVYIYANGALNIDVDFRVQ